MAISGFLTHKTEAAQECHSVSMKVAAKTVRVWDPWNTPNRIRCSDWLGNFSQRHTSTKVEPLLSESNSVSLNINKAYKVLGGSGLASLPLQPHCLGDPHSPPSSPFESPLCPWTHSAPWTMGALLQLCNFLCALKNKCKCYSLKRILPTFHQYGGITRYSNYFLCLH